jgi:lactate dehydrogenase-like 2-hydroxyacid dehydrogenase
MDNIDVDYAKSKGITSGPPSSSESVAELVFAHLFSGVRFRNDSNRTMPLEGDSNFDLSVTMLMESNQEENLGISITVLVRDCKDGSSA